MGHADFSDMVGYVAIAVAVFAIIFGTLTYFEQQEAENQALNLRISREVGHNMDDFRNKNMTAFVLGYTGEVGKQLVKELASSKIFQKVVLIGRRKVEYDDPEISKMEQVVTDFDKLEEHKESFNGFNVGYCCLGTTRGKSGAEGFYKVDHDYVMNSAQIAKATGLEQFHFVSSQGANANASLLYTKTKGEVEEKLKVLDFPQLYIYRPGVLLCNRVESRPGEACIRAVFKPISYFFPTTGSCPTTTVAKAIVATTVSNQSPKWEMVDNKAIHQRGAQSKS